MHSQKSSPNWGGGPRAERGVEGRPHMPTATVIDDNIACPSTILRMVPLPVSGRLA